MYYHRRRRQDDYEENYPVLSRLPKDIASPLRRKYRLYPKVKLGEGYFGEAFQRGKRKVVKLTTDASEAEAVYKMIKEGFYHPNMARYYSIHELEHNRWIITMERAQGRRLNDLEERILNFVDGYKKYSYEDLMNDEEFQEHAETKGIFVENIPTEIYNTFREQVRSLWLAVEEFDEWAGLDIHAGNCLVDDDHNIKFFDAIRTFPPGNEFRYIPSIERWSGK